MLLRTVILAGQKNHRHLSSSLRLFILTKLPVGLKSVHLRHHNIQQDEVRIIFLQKRQKILAGFHGTYPDFLASEQVFGSLQGKCIVVDDNYPVRFTHTSSSPWNRYDLYLRGYHRQLCIAACVIQCELILLGQHIKIRNLVGILLRILNASGIKE